MGWSRYGKQAKARLIPGTISDLLMDEGCLKVPEIQTQLSIDKMEILQSVFPSMQHDVIQDVLIAASFQVENAAEMLAQLSSSPTDTSNDDRDAEMFTMVSMDMAEAPIEEFHWSLGENDWQVMERLDERNQENSYAQALKRTTTAVPSLPITQVPLPSLSVKSSRSYTLSASKHAANAEEEWTAKSFGTCKHQSRSKARRAKAKAHA